MPDIILNNNYDILNNRQCVMRNDMRTLSISLSEDLYEKIKLQVPAKQVSKFVAKAIDAQLSERISALRKAYIEANQDEERNKEIEEWDAID